MPLSLLSINAAVICDDKELETYDVKQEDTSSLSAYIASEAGKKFKIAYSNDLSSFDVAVFLHIDGQLVSSVFLRSGTRHEFLGPYNTARSVLPFKFQELQLVDPDLEDAPVAPEMGMIELKAYRCQPQRKSRNPGKPLEFMHENLHRGRVSELSKKAGWHHVTTGDEIFVGRLNVVQVDYYDSRTGPPYVSIKVFYRPRELLRAQGIIPENNLGRQESPIINRKRAREDGSPGPSRRRRNIKSEDFSEETRTQRIRALQAELDALKGARKSGTSVKRELRSPSPIVVRNNGEVIDLTLDG